MKSFSRLPGFSRWIYFLVLAWSSLISVRGRTVLGSESSAASPNLTGSNATVATKAAGPTHHRLNAPTTPKTGAYRLITADTADTAGGPTAAITTDQSEPSVTTGDAVMTLKRVDISTEFSLIPAGVFAMGDALDGVADTPVRQVTVSAFYMAKHETTQALWEAIRDWGMAHGYTDLPEGGGIAPTHPVQEITWFDAIKWCNARSEKDGLTPYYTVDGSPMRTGQKVPVINATADGYRLPTEAEWEKAARGGLSGHRFPWGDTITHSQANYWSESTYDYDISLTREHHHTHAQARDNWPYTAPVGTFMANDYGLYDMAGNVWEWCWDWYAPYASGPQNDPKGPASGTRRTRRGGCWHHPADTVRTATRHHIHPEFDDNTIGFRVVLFADASASTAPVVRTGTAVAGEGVGTFTIHGVVTSDGRSPVTERGVVYGLAPEPTLTHAMTSPAGAGSGPFASDLTDLELDVTYHARAYATNAIGTRYGADITFKTANIPTGFGLISEGAFAMGDALDGLADAPVRQVTVNGFYMAQHETTKALWDEVRAWGASHGYTDLPDGSGKSAQHPVQKVTWFDVVKWCNARSEKDELEPCYMMDNRPFRTGSTIPSVNWTANGYRLPTEAEWEKAARGGLTGKRFHWGDTINHSQANYGSESAYIYDISPTRGTHPTYTVGSHPYTSPVGSFAANGYGLYDMTGNVWEWCWDWYGAYASGPQRDPKGTASGPYRVTRGGSWYDPARHGRAAARSRVNPANQDADLGFRVLRLLVP
jgi:formylglycine-generating enzyme required for sulfatase activity